MSFAPVRRRRQWGGNLRHKKSKKRSVYDMRTCGDERCRATAVLVPASVSGDAHHERVGRPCAIFATGRAPIHEPPPRHVHKRRAKPGGVVCTVPDVLCDEPRIAYRARTQTCSASSSLPCDPIWHNSERLNLRAPYNTVDLGRRLQRTSDFSVCIFSSDICPGDLWDREETVLGPRE